MSATVLSHLRLHLQRMAQLKATGDIELRVQDGKCGSIRPPRMPRRSIDSIAFASAPVTSEQHAVIELVSQALIDAARSKATGSIYVIVKKGVPHPELDDTFIDVMPDAAPRRPAKGQLAEAS